MKAHLLGFALLSAIALIASAPAHAQNGSLTRSFVSSTGLDTNACTITAPCQSFAVAYTKIGANGIIAALDPGKYGPITITGPVTINGNGWAAITGPSTGTATAITINAVSGNVILTGLEIDGAGASNNGIVFNSGDSLTITNSSVQNFVGTGNAGNGIFIQPSTGTLDFVIADTVMSNNGNYGLLYVPSGGTPTAHGVIDHVTATGNSYGGIGFDPANTSSGATVAAISDSIASNNSFDGIVCGIGSGTMTLSIDGTTITSNPNVGILVQATAKVLLGRSVITGNGTGVANDTSPNTFYTFGNNQIGLNTTTDGSATLNSATYTLH
jgi:hypothetical protein